MTAPLELHRFAREYEKEFPGTHATTKGAYGFLKYEDRLVGALVFFPTYATGSLIQSGWFLDWVWIEPSARRRGVLTTAWPQLLNKFGDFDLSHPIPPAMKAAVRKLGTPNQKRLLEDGDGPRSA